MNFTKNILTIIFAASAYIACTAVDNKLDAEMLALVHATIKDGTRENAPACQAYYSHYVGEEKVEIWVKEPAVKGGEKIIHAYVQGTCKNSKQHMEKELERFKAGQIKNWWWQLVPTLQTNLTKCSRENTGNQFPKFVCTFSAALDPKTAQATIKLLEERAKKLHFFKQLL